MAALFPDIWEMCSICDNPFGPDLGGKITPCGHVFHYQCILETLLKSQFCPVCHYKLHDYFTTEENESPEPSPSDSPKTEYQSLREPNPFMVSNDTVSTRWIKPMKVAKMQTVRFVGGRCSICQERFRWFVGGKKVACGHVYHADCISPWLSRNDSCPVCRKKII